MSKDDHSKEDLNKGVPNNHIPPPRKGKKVKAVDFDGEYTSIWAKKRAKVKNNRIAKIQIQQKKKRLERLSELMLEGRSVAEMADMLGVSDTQIRNDIKELDEVWRANTVGNVEHFKRQYIRRKNYVLLEAKKAYEHSKTKKTKKKEREKTTTGGEGGPERETETIEMEEDRDGDPRFLKIFSETATDIAEAQGVKTEPDNKGDTYILPDLPDMVQRFLGGDTDENAGAVDEDGKPVDDKDGYNTVSNAEDVDYEEVDG